jgi:hypothetical protein
MFATGQADVLEKLLTGKTSHDCVVKLVKGGSISGSEQSIQCFEHEDVRSSQILVFSGLD